MKLVRCSPAAMLLVALSALPLPAADVSPNAYLLYESASKGDFDTVRNLLTDEPGLTGQTFEHGITPLHGAAMSNDSRIVTLMLEKGANVDALGGQLHLTPLYIAVAQGHEKSALALLDQKANPNVKAVDATDGSVTDVTPLHLAALQGRGDLTHMLVSHGASMDTKTSRGETPYDYAVRGNGTMARQVLHVYRQLGTSKGRPLAALIVAIEARDSAAVARSLASQPRLAQTILENNATPLHLAASIGNRAGCELLLARRADPTIRDRGGSTPSDQALDAGHTDLAQMLRVREHEKVSKKR